MKLADFLYYTRCTSGLFGIAGLAGYVDRGEGLVCAVCLLAVSGLLAVCAKIGSKRKRK